MLQPGSQSLPINKDPALMALEDNNTETSPQGLEYPTGVGVEEFGLGHCVTFTIYETVGTHLETQNREIAQQVQTTQNQTAQGMLNLLLPFGSVVPFELKTVQQKATGYVPTTIEGIKEFGGKLTKSVKSLIGENTSINGQTTQSKDFITLYMPSKITTAYAATWEKEGLSTAHMIRDVAKLIRNYSEPQGHLVGEIIKDLTIEPLSKSLDAVFETVGLNFNSHAVISATTRSVANPFMHMLFHSVEPRTFEFAFIFTPRNQTEADTVFNIIKTFKKHMLPSISAGGRYYKYPSEFLIQYWTGDQENFYLNKIKRCVLTNMTVDYTASDSPAFFEAIPGKGSPPVHSTITLTFAEIIPLTAEDAIEGY